MFEKVLRKLREASESQTGVRLKDNELDIMEELFTKGKQNQYKLEKNLRKSGRGISHSTLTGKLKRLGTYGFIIVAKGVKGPNYCELTPLGLSILIFKGRITFSKAMSYVEKNQLQYYELLALFQPNLINWLEKHSAWFVSQLTLDLLVIYHIAKPSELRRQTIKFALAKSKGVEPEPVNLGYEVQPLCVQRIEVEGKGICKKQSEVCIYKAREVAKCPILKQQMLKELEKLEKH